jgi:hypothetical protein
MNIDAYGLTTFQQCQRRWLLEQSWRVVRLRPKSLFDSCLRQAVFAISNGADPVAQIQSSRTRFLSQAANPGLDVTEGVDSWKVANDYAGMLSTVLTAVARLTLLTVQRLSPISISSTSESQWSPLSWADESGVLHRWITIDKFDDDVLAREAHGWYVFGDIALIDAPLTLHVIDIGQTRSGRRHSPWVRAFKHPIIAHRYKFIRKNKYGNHTTLSDQWIPLWYTDQPNPDPQMWVDLMDSDGITPTLIHHIAIAQPSSAVRKDTLRQLCVLTKEMDRIARRLPRVADGMTLPMARGACDGLIPCPWQDACYRERPAEGIGDLGLYQIKTAPSIPVLECAKEDVWQTKTDIHGNASAMA